MPLDAKTTSLDPASALSPASIISASTGTTRSVVSCPWSEHTTSDTSSPRSRILPTAATTSATFASAALTSARCSPEPSSMTCWEWSGSQSQSVCRAYPAGASSGRAETGGWSRGRRQRRT